MKEKYFNENNIETLLRSPKTSNLVDFNILQEFYLLYNENPVIINNSDNYYYNFKNVIKLITKYYPEYRIIKQCDDFSLTNGITFSQILIEIKEGVLLYLIGDYVNISFNSLKLKNNNLFDNVVYSFNILSKENLDNNDIKNITNIFNKSKYEKIEKINISLMTTVNNNLVADEFEIKLTNLEHLDLHYGKDFTKFNKELVKKLSTTDKGLTLLHGDPGTGKTTYIRYLIKQLKDIDNSNQILYFPHSMFGCITDPNFISFISNWSNQYSGKKYILIEDAEPLLVSRDTNRNIGITNLLNITDGLLNDIFNIQVIATFNTNISNLDKALLRPERLIARKEFNNLLFDDAKKLAEYLKIDVSKIKNNMSIAEIYSLLDDNSILIHDLHEKSSNIGFFK